MAEKGRTEERCLTCRKLYEDENIVSIDVHCDRVCDTNDQKQKPGSAKTMAADGTKKISNVDVNRRNLVHVVGIPAVLANEETLQRKDYFGQFGQILKISVFSVFKTGVHSPHHSSSGSGASVNVAYAKEEDAIRCIQSVNGYVLHGKVLKACLGTREHCNAWLKQTPCSNPDRLCLHDEDMREDCSIKEEILRKKRVRKADWGDKRVESCGMNGDNFASNSCGSDEECSSFQNDKSAWDNCKRRKFDAAKVKEEVSELDDTETSSVESTSGLTVGGEAFTTTGSSVEITSHDFTLLGDKIIKLDKDDCEFMMVRGKFYTGLGMLASFATIKGIYKDCHRSTSGQARLQAFKRQEEITRAARGDSNVRYAWHGTSKTGVSVIVLHGFGQPRIAKSGAMYGVGVYLAPEDYSHVSAVYSDVDENGEQHMMLCRVIMGNMERVEQGSEQFHPTSEDYDTGVDDICNPRRYVVWSTHMNTHILPEYIISFKLAPPWNDIIAALRGKHLVGKPLSTEKGLQYDCQQVECKTPSKTSCATCNPVSESLAKQAVEPKTHSRAPRSPWMSFPMLFLVMKAKLSKAQMCELQQHYLQFKVGKMPRNDLIKVVRSIAGDRLLADSIRSMQAQERATNSSNAAFNGNVAGEGRGACDN